jgi:hypothetical protein
MRKERQRTRTKRIRCMAVLQVHDKQSNVSSPSKDYHCVGEPAFLYNVGSNCKSAAAPKKLTYRKLLAL